MYCAGLSALGAISTTSPEVSDVVDDAELGVADTRGLSTGECSVICVSDEISV